MGVSINVFNVPLPELGPLVQHAERSGFERVFFGDHLIAPMETRSKHPRSDEENSKVLYEQTPLTDLLVTFGYLSGITERIGLATGIYILPLRDPVVTARAAATVQLHSRGRLLFGIGAGWLREEFDIVGVPFEGRGRRFDEMIDVMRSLWTGEVVDHVGEIWSFKAVQLWPPPVPPIPLVFGGTSAVALARAARLGDGWFSPTNFSLEDVLRTRDALEALRVEHGTAERPFRYHVRVEGDQDAANLATYRAAGFDDLVFATSREWRRRDVQYSLEDRCAMLSEYAAAAGLS